MTGHSPPGLPCRQLCRRRRRPAGSLRPATGARPIRRPPPGGRRPDARILPRVRGHVRQTRPSHSFRLRPISTGPSALLALGSEAECFSATPHCASQPSRTPPLGHSAPRLEETAHRIKLGFVLFQDLVGFRPQPELLEPLYRRNLTAAGTSRNHVVQLVHNLMRLVQ